MTTGSVGPVKRTLALALTVIAGAATLTACTDEQAYCVDLAKYAAGAVNVDPQKPADYVKILDDAKKLQDSAPDAVKDDWGVVVAFAEKAKKAGSDRVELATAEQGDRRRDDGVQGHHHATPRTPARSTSPR